MTATAIPIKSARQSPLEAYIDLTYDMLVTGTDLNAIQVPNAAVITGGDLVVDTALNSATSDVLSVGDSGTYNRYLSAQSIAATGRTALTLTGYKYTAPTWITVRWVGVGAVPSQGALRVRISYIVRGRQQYNQGPDYVKRLS